MFFKTISTLKSIFIYFIACVLGTPLCCGVEIKACIVLNCTLLTMVFGFALIIVEFFTPKPPGHLFPMSGFIETSQHGGFNQYTCSKHQILTKKMFFSPSRASDFREGSLLLTECFMPLHGINWQRSMADIMGSPFPSKFSIGLRVNVFHEIITR